MHLDNPSLNISKFLDLANRFIGIIDEDRRPKAKESLEQLTTKLSLGLFRIVVMGEVKKGKTSFIGALLGEYNLLPVHHEVATSAVYKIMYGLKPAITVFFKSDDENQELKYQSITAEQISEYGTEAGNPGNEKNVDFIGIELPSPMLRSGVVIIDTPGLGGVYRKHREITYRYVPKADAVFFVLDSVDSVITEDEIDFLKDLKKFTRQIYFVQTKADMAGKAQVKAWKNRNLEIISKCLKEQNQPDLSIEDIPYFTVCNKFKQQADQCDSPQTIDGFEERKEDLHDSGFHLIYRFLNHYLIPRKEDLIVSSAMLQLRDLIRIEGNYLKERRKIIQKKGKDELLSMEKELQETLERLNNWRQGGFRDTERKLQETIEDLKRKYRNEIQDTYDVTGIIFDDYFKSIQKELQSADEIGRKAKQILNDYAAQCTHEGQDLLEKYQKDFLTAYDEVFRSGVKSMKHELMITIPDHMIPKIDKGHIDDDAIKSGVLWGSAVGGITISVFSAYFGANVGTAILTIGLTGLNPLGWAVAGTIVGTSAFAGIRSYRKVRQQKFERALKELENAMRNISSRAGRAVIKQFDDQSLTMERTARDNFNQFYIQTQAEITGRLDEIRLTKERSNDANRDKLRQIGSTLAEIIRLDREIVSALKLKAHTSDG